MLAVMDLEHFWICWMATLLVFEKQFGDQVAVSDLFSFVIATPQPSKIPQFNLKSNLFDVVFFVLGFTVRSFCLFGSFLQNLRPFNWCYPRIVPAMVADNREAKEPPKTALIPNSDNVFRCPGAREPIPPIWIPIEAKLANPQSM